MASDGPSPHPHSLRLGLAAHQPLRPHHAQSLLRPSFHDQRTPHFLESHPERGAPLSRRDDERRHAVGSHSALALHLYFAACNPSSNCRIWVLDHLCSNLSQSERHRRPDHWTCVFTFSSSAFACWIEMNFSFESLFAIWSLSLQRFHYYFYLSIGSSQYRKYCTILILVLCLLWFKAVGLLILLKLCPAFTFLQQLMTKGLWVIYTYNCSPRLLWSEQPRWATALVATESLR